MRALATVSDMVRRARTPDDVDAWVHFLGAFGPVVRAPYAVLFETSPSQLLAAGRDWPESFGYRLTSSRAAVWVARQQERAWRDAAACCVASQWAADSLVRDHGIDARKIHVVGYGRNVDVAPPPDRDWSTPRFLFVGNDWPRKNGDAVLRAFARVRHEVPGAQLDIVANHPPIVADGVVDHGRLATTGPLAVFDPAAKSDLEALFRAATCLVVPSHFEAFGLVYVEAGAAGIASIAGSHGGTGVSVGDGGIIVDADNDDAIYRAMRAMCDPDRARELGARALARSRSFTWSAVTERIVRALDLDVPGVELADFL